MAKDNFEKSGVEKPIRSGAKQVEKPTRKPMSDRTASAAGRWPKRDEAWSAPDTSRSVYAPPPPDKAPGQATHSTNQWAVEWLKSDTSNQSRKPSIMK